MHSPRSADRAVFFPIRSIAISFNNEKFELRALSDCPLNGMTVDQPETPTMFAADLAFVIALAVVIGCNLYFAPRFGVRIAMQWGTDGKPTWHAPKAVALWGMVAFMIVV